MIKLTTPSRTISVNPALIASIVPGKTFAGTTVTMASGEKHFVTEARIAVERMVEKARTGA